MPNIICMYIVFGGVNGAIPQVATWYRVRDFNAILVYASA